MPHVMFQMPQSAKRGRYESNTKLSLIFRICFSTGSSAEGGYLLSQHGKVKPGRDHPRFKAIVCVDQIHGGWLCKKKNGVLESWKAICHSVSFHSWIYSQGICSLRFPLRPIVMSSTWITFKDSFFSLHTISKWRRELLTRWKKFAYCHFFSN